MTSYNVLVVDDELDIRELIQEILTEEGYKVTVASSAREAKEARSNRDFDLILLDIWMPDTDGISLLKEWSESNQLNSSVVMMSGHGTVDTAIESTHLGASSFIEKPLSIAKLLRTVEEALAEKKSKLGSSRISEFSSFINIGRSNSLKSLRSELRNIANIKSNILIFGEEGTGRVQYAKYLHNISNRSINPCVVCDAVTMSSSNAEAQVFGEEIQDKVLPGHLDQANNGTLIIKNLSHSDTRAQYLLQTVLESDQYKRVNGNAENQLNIRTIGIAGEDYIVDIEEGKLSRELISSLNIKTIHIPPLREHAEDIPDFIKYYVDELVDTQDLVFRRFSVAAQNRLRNFPWPGNHIELKNIVQRLLINGLSEDVTLDEVESELQKEQNQGENFIQKDLLSLPLREAREQFERAYLQQQLILCDGKVGKLAKRVGVERTHLYRKLKSLEINFNKKEV